jgi:uncharacterized membrane protein YfcA
MRSFIIYIFVGFLAQLVDGSLGMAYGVISNTFLLNTGLPPLIASASVHVSELFITGVSGFWHFKFGNINKDLVKKLIIPGVFGGFLGAYILTAVPGNTIKPYVSAYLLLIGVWIVYKAFRKIEIKNTFERVKITGFIGGLFDSIGGGGWGPIVTTSLVARGGHPRYAIGSVNLAEFFVTFVQVLTFVVLVKSLVWQPIAGLLLGGILAAPLAAFICKKVSAKNLMIGVGIIIVLSSSYSIWSFLK